MISYAELKTAEAKQLQAAAEFNKYNASGSTDQNEKKLILERLSQAKADYNQLAAEYAKEQQVIRDERNAKLPPLNLPKR